MAKEAGVRPSPGAASEQSGTVPRIPARSVHRELLRPWTGAFRHQKLSDHDWCWIAGTARTAPVQVALASLEIAAAAWPSASVPADGSNDLRLLPSSSSLSLPGFRESRQFWPVSGLRNAGGRARCDKSPEAAARPGAPARLLPVALPASRVPAGRLLPRPDRPRLLLAQVPGRMRDAVVVALARRNKD